MRKELRDKLRQDPIKWELYKQKKNKYKKERLIKIKNDTVLYKKYKEKCERRNKKIRDRNKAIRQRRQSISPYYQKPKGWQRYKCHIFQTMARRTNQRCKINKVKAIDLWSLTKKQECLCKISGEKLTAQNISIDHIIPIANGGTNALNNLRLVTIKVNTAKHTMSDAEFFSFCQNIVNRNLG